ncbi:MAG: protein kinase, partial [Candidatus Eiseniibacteriota bacterium]
MIGKTISHYKILSKLGEGGMGVAYKAEDSKLKRTVALKFLPPELTRDSEAKARFMHEAQAAAGLSHPNICTVHEIDESEGQIFIASECIEGETLKERIQSGPMKIDEVLSTVIQVAEGLREAHERGIVHRDVKSANIMVTPRGQAKIMDFGLAKLAGGTKLTKTGTTVGTIAYMSPEQARGEGVDHRTDIWSLGVVLYEMVTGRLPFKGDYGDAVVYWILNEQPTHIRKLRSDVPAGIDKIIKRALEKSPEKRYQRIEELEADLRSAREEHVNKASTQEPSRGKHSIAVLPFIDMSPKKDQEYFCDGLAEELINALTHVKTLRVAARTSAFSFKGEKYDVREIGDKLNVDTVLEGSIRKAGDRLRITAQLVSVADGYHLWSEKYDRNMEDIFAIQDEISLSIVDKLKIELLGDEAALLVKRGTEDLEAYDLYIKGRFFWEQRGKGLEKAIEYFNRALARDPDYAQAYTGLADSYSLLAFYGFTPPGDVLPKARENALKALQIDDTLAEAHSSLGFIHQWYDWDHAAAENEFKRALELNPSYAPAHYWYCTTLFLTDRSDEALYESERAIAVDPLSIPANTFYAMFLIGVREFDRAIVQLKRTLELDPDYPLAHWLLGSSYCHQSRYDDAIAESRKAVDLSGNIPWTLSSLGWVYGMSGRATEAQKVLAELADRSKREYIRPMCFVHVYSGLTEFDQAHAWLIKAYEERDLWLILMSIDP